MKLHDWEIIYTLYPKFIVVIESSRSSTRKKIIDITLQSFVIFILKSYFCYVLISVLWPTLFCFQLDQSCLPTNKSTVQMECSNNFYTVLKSLCSAILFVLLCPVMKQIWQNCVLKKKTLKRQKKVNHNMAVDEWQSYTLHSSFDQNKCWHAAKLPKICPF